YLRLLTWTLNEEKVEAFQRRLTPVHPQWWYGWVESVFIVLMIGAGVGAWMYGGDLLVAASGLEGILALLAKLVLFLVAFAVARFVLDRVSFALGDEFAEWRWYLRGRVHARFRDHRMWMFFGGIGALGLTVLLLMT